MMKNIWLERAVSERWKAPISDEDVWIPIRPGVRLPDSQIERRVFVVNVPDGNADSFLQKMKDMLNEKCLAKQK